MQPDPQMIDRFYQGKCTPREAQQVMNWLLENETEPSLAKDWSDASPAVTYSRQYEADMLAFVQQAVQPQPAPVRRMRRMHWAGWAVAASIVLLAGVVWFAWLPNKKGRAAARTAVAVKDRLMAWNAPKDRPLTIRMVDGSTVIVEPGSVLRYDSVSYNTKDRVVSLQGKAVFFVAPNKSKPFRVNANGFSTTALGTSFMVTAKPAGDVQVKLYTGKVVIRSTAAYPSFKDVYLTPGEEVVVAGIDHQSVVSRWLPNTLPQDETTKMPVPQTKEVQLAGDTLVFNNASLLTVLNVLKRRYRVNILYSQNSVADAYFTGSVLPGDAIELILRTVTRINGLTLIAAGDGFVIK